MAHIIFFFLSDGTLPQIALELDNLLNSTLDMIESTLFLLNSVLKFSSFSSLNFLPSYR